MPEEPEPPRLISDSLVFPSKRPLSLAQLERLYALTDWRFILTEREIESRYGDDGATALAVVKAFALPYLVELPTEMTLVRRLSEDISLRVLCQYPVKLSTSESAIRSVMYRFRDGFSSEFLEELMFKVLISLVLSGRSPNMNLPFVVELEPTEYTPESNLKYIVLDPYRQPALVAMPRRPTQSADFIEGIPTSEWFAMYPQFKNRLDESERKPVVGQLPLPVEVTTVLGSGENIRFKIELPSWFNLGYPIGGRDTANSLGSRVRRSGPPTCQVIVTRNNGGRHEVLLSVRLGHGLGAGSYTLPGGKKNDDESFENCAKRELLEETGLRIVESRPISYYYHRIPDRSPTLTVGALVEIYEGRVLHKEPTQNTAWRWYPLHDLPWPLFGPSEVVLKHYLRNQFPKLTWSDVEAPAPIRSEQILDDCRQFELFEGY